MTISEFQCWKGSTVNWDCSVQLESGFKSDFVSIKCNFEYANIHSSSAHKIQYPGSKRNFSKIRLNITSSLTLHIYYIKLTGFT